MPDPGQGELRMCVVEKKLKGITVRNTNGKTKNGERCSRCLGDGSRRKAYTLRGREECVCKVRPAYARESVPACLRESS